MPQPPIDPRWPKILSLSVHEFRTPMTVVSGYIRMLLKERAGALTEPQRRLLEEAEKSCGRLSALLSEVSELSNLEAGTAPFNKSSLDLRAVLRDAIERLPALPDREVEVKLESGEAAAPIDGDPVRLTQALQSVIMALRRELIGSEVLLVRQRTGNHGHDVLIGDSATLQALESDQSQPGPAFDEWRGGVGLSLPVARRVLNAHGASLYGAPGDGKAGARVVFPARR